ncbi:RE1 [Symbiodinium sp. CCMP2592]|nr:RE1 [Symbiodinium sp. CCMP2592]
MAERCQAWRLPIFARLRAKYSLHEAVAKGCRVGLRAGPQEPLLQQGWRRGALLGLREEVIQELEHEASKLQQNQNYHHSQVEKLLEKLPWKSSPVRPMMKTGNEGYLILGMYAYGNHYGVTNYTRRLPQTTTYLLQYMQHWAKENFVCTSLVLNKNGLSPLHRDLHNQNGNLNRIVGFGAYQGGKLWVQEDPNRARHETTAKVLPNGERATGSTHDVRHRMLKFNPKAWHGPESWQGDRTTLTAFVARGSSELSGEDCEWLQGLGFRIPGSDFGKESALALERIAQGSASSKESPKQRDEKIKKQLYLLHAATGHGSVKTLVEALKRRQASEHVLRLARDFSCPVCKEKGRIQSRHLASLEALPPKWHTVSADIGHWQHPKTGEHVQFMLVIDEGSRFRVARVLSRGSKQQPNAATCLNYLREGWAQYFGMPRTLRLDPAGCFRGEAMSEFCDKHGIYLDIIPADGHWQVGVCEQAVQGVKAVMQKLAADDEDATPETLLAQTIHTFNARDHVRGFSPVQHAFGRSPDITGRIIASPNQVPDELVVESACEDFEKSARLRAEAEKAHVQWHAEQRISRALNSRAKPVFDYRPGDLIYFWRSQARFWTFTKVAEEIGGNSYEDVSMDKPSEAEWHRAQDVTHETPPTRYRFRGKRAAAEPTEEWDTMPEEEQGTSQASRPQRARPRPQAHSTNHLNSGEVWTQRVPESAWSAQVVDYWQQQEAAVEVSLPLPESSRGWAKATANLQSYFVGALKRRTVEVSEKRLNPQELQQFREAKAIEVKNFLAAEAFQTLPPHLRPHHSQAINMRWILTWKQKEDGSKRAKARAVLLGYQDPAYEHRPTTSPVMSRQSRQMLLQAAANHCWTAMNIPAGTVTKLKRACYGLVDAPLEWYRTIHEFLLSLGLERLWSDPCVWAWRQNGVLRGLISGHVDDFLFAGSSDDAGWQRIVSEIQARFKWGDWDTGKFTQCGVQVEQTDTGFTLSQSSYLENTPEINLNSSRRKDRSAPVTDWERTQLCGVLGAISWHAQQVAPQYSAEVSLLLSEVNKGSVDTIIRTNQLLANAKAQKHHSLKIHRFPPGQELGMFAWVDAGSQNRPDGGSTQGIVIGLAPVGLLRGDVCPISLMAWHSNRIDRTCRSPGAAETQAAVSGEDLLYYARYEWSEIMYGVADAEAPDEAVTKVTGTVISDSRNVFDKLQTEVVSIKGAERKADIELLSLKEAQARTKVQVRWVHSEAQLANSLTKCGGSKEIELFYKMGSSWRIVEDEKMRSARKRKAEGLQPLQHETASETILEYQKELCED